MIIKQLTISGKPIYIPFAELGNKYAEIDMNKQFKRKLSCGRVFSITRNDFRDVPCPMTTDIISDKAMNWISDALMHRLNTIIDKQTDDNAFYDAYWTEYEDLMIELGVPYVEDDDTANYAKGDRVFYMDGKMGSYATVMSVCSNKVDVIIKPDNEENICVDSCEIIKEF